jgi:hypothetical protein
MTPIWQRSPSPPPLRLAELVVGFAEFQLPGRITGLQQLREMAATEPVLPTAGQARSQVA